MSMSNTERPQAHVCTGENCADDEAHYDALVAANPSYGLPCGWSRYAWDGYVEASIAHDLKIASGRTTEDTVKALEAAQAWCVFIALLSTAAWALTYRALSEDGCA